MNAFTSPYLGDDREDPAGGPAFPKVPDSIRNGSAGMSLRDWFAGQALPAVIDATSAGQHQPLGSNEIGLEAAMARDAYKLADAMIAARKVRP